MLQTWLLALKEGSFDRSPETRRADSFVQDFSFARAIFSGLVFYVWIFFESEGIEKGEEKRGR